MLDSFNSYDLNSLLSLLVALASVVLTNFVALVTLFINLRNARKDRQIRKAELFYNNKFSAYKELLNAHAKIIVAQRPNNLIEFVAALEVAASVSDDNLQKLIFIILSELKDNEYIANTDTDKKIDECIKLISAEYRESITKIL